MERLLLSLCHSIAVVTAIDYSDPFKAARVGSLLWAPVPEALRGISDMEWHCNKKSSVDTDFH